MTNAINDTSKMGPIPDLVNKLHWSNSANVLCNYMKEQRYLDLVLRNQAIIPRYVMEPIGYLGLGELKTICFPRLFTELQTCLLENKEIIWRHPFDHFHVSGIHPVNENISFDDYIGKDSFRYEFYEGPIFVSLLGAEFNLFSRTRMDDFVMTNIVWDDGGREAAEVYISDAPDKQWTLSRLYITEDDMNKKPAQAAP